MDFANQICLNLGVEKLGHRMSVQPPRPKGPPLNALRAFEAAARLGSFSRAADELCVTPGAIAQHISSLESWAGAPLFRRRARGVTLSLLGRAVAPALGEAFDRLADASHLLRRMAAPAEIRVATLPSIAQLWLSPRLPAIRAANEDLTISVTALEQPPNLLREPYDLLIFFGLAASPGIATVSLARDAVAPVCAPAVAQRLIRPADLANETLLHDAAWRDDWAVWLARNRVGGVDTSTGPTFSLYALAVEEAVHGAGVLIGHLPLVARHLADGRLVMPFAGQPVARDDLTAAVREADARDDGPIADLIRRLCA